MQKHADKKAKWLPLPATIMFVYGCAPVPPPVSPELFVLGFRWLSAGLLVGLGIWGWKKYCSTKPPKTDYLIEALNAINQRLVILEKQIEEIAKKQDK